MSEVTQRSESEAEEIASKLGLECFFPLPNELFIDIDGNKGDSYNTALEEIMKQNGYEIEEYLVTTSKSGNQHFYLRLNQDVKPLIRLVIQACLGSDKTKEFLSLSRLFNGSDGYCALFETKFQAGRVRKWRAKHENDTSEVEQYSFL